MKKTAKLWNSGAATVLKKIELAVINNDKTKNRLILYRNSDTLHL